MDGREILSHRLLDIFLIFSNITDKIVKLLVLISPKLLHNKPLLEITISKVILNHYDSLLTVDLSQEQNFSFYGSLKSF